MKSKHSFFKFVSVMILTSLISACGDQSSMINHPINTSVTSPDNTPDSSTSIDTLEEITELSSAEESTLQDYLSKIKDTDFPNLDPSIQKKLILELKEKMLIEAAVLDHDEETLELGLRKLEGPQLTLAHGLGLLWLGVASTLAARDFARWSDYANMRDGVRRSFKRLVIDQVNKANLASAQIGSSPRVRSLTRDMILTDSRMKHFETSIKLEKATTELMSRFNRTKKAYLESLEMVFDGRLRGAAAKKRLATTTKGLARKLNIAISFDKTASLSRRNQAAARMANHHKGPLIITGTIMIASWATAFIVGKVYSDKEKNEIDQIKICLSREQAEALKDKIAIAKAQLRQAHRLLAAYEADQALNLN